MIRSNLEIQKAIDECRLIITPDPQPRSPEPALCVDFDLCISDSLCKAAYHLFTCISLCQKALLGIGGNTEEICQFWDLISWYAKGPRPYRIIARC
jgi:hypothetical protein